MKAAIYTRVSTNDQADVEFNSCETQELKIRSFIKSQDNIEVYKVYSDQGYSGANTDRPQLQEMLRNIQNGKINTVIAYKIDRLTRSPKDFYQLIEILEQNKATFISVTERFDTSTPSGRLLRNIMLTFAQFERELISERIRDKVFEKAKKGMWNCGHTPFGYVRDNSKKLVIESSEAKVIKKMFQFYISTGSLSAVYAKIKRLKVLTRKGAIFTKNTIFRILRNVVYIGKVSYHGTVYPGIHEPIISQEVFDEVQKLHGKLEKRSVSYNYTLFPSLVFCKECGSTMVSIFSNRIKGDLRVRYFYYSCSSIRVKDRSLCSIRQVSADRLDRYIIEYLQGLVTNQQYLDSLIFMLNNKHKDSLTECEPDAPTLNYKAEILKKILERIIQASSLRNKYEKLAILKRHIEKVIYSKETIEVKILYSESADEMPYSAFGPLRDPSAQHQFSGNTKNKAACRHLSTPPSRLSHQLALTGIEPVPWP